MHDLMRSLSISGLVAPIWNDRACLVQVSLRDNHQRSAACHSKHALSSSFDICALGTVSPASVLGSTREIARPQFTPDSIEFNRIPSNDACNFDSA
jgi:hypothetical protein